jgi:hypothetical protein
MRRWPIARIASELSRIDQNSGRPRQASTPPTRKVDLIPVLRRALEQELTYVIARPPVSEV